jgi:hypothetical protein
MRDLTYETLISMPKPQAEEFWRRLNLRETFTRGQLFPYRVEFMAEQQSGPFKDGELNIHHGPLLSAHGRIDGLTPTHRGLCYYFGAYALSFRLIRLVRLDFYREEAGIRVRFRAYVAPWFQPFWGLSNRIFWLSFRLAMFF